ncbi:MAG: L,D-transpeptidase [Actinobacteria bacterium]|nr:L,D-transpeptidase [Actinomycetota bacterium]
MQNPHSSSHGIRKSRLVRLLATTGAAVTIAGVALAVFASTSFLQRAMNADGTETGSPVAAADPGPAAQDPGQSGGARSVASGSPPSSRTTATTVAAAPTTTTTVAPSPPTTLTALQKAVGGALFIVVKPVVEPLKIYKSASTTAEVTHSFPFKDKKYGFPAVFSAVGQTITSDGTLWYEVYVPKRPNMTKGWVRASDVTAAVTTHYLQIHLDAHRLELYEEGQLVRTYPIAVGKSSAPTPTGDFFISNEMQTGNPGGAYGPIAMGISAFSDVLTDWPEDGQVGIHGTNSRSSIGNSVSHGCIRLFNEHIIELSATIDPGTPVFIRK